MIGMEEIQKVLPHRYPFLLVDRIIDIEPGKRVVGIKNVSCNEPFFQGHFPGNPIMPGVLIIESMAQVGAYAALNYPEVKDKIAFLTSVDRARFRHPVVPGDRLRIEVALIRMRGNFGRLGCSAYVEGKLVADAELTFALVDRGEQ
jgi:3-hydroxyacyl-[acyl-carrier-protein] dehydratase